MEASLRHSEEQHRTLISNIPGVTFRRAGGGIWQPLFLSKPVETLTGWPAEALLSQPQRMEGLVLPQDIPGLTEAVYSAIDAGVAYSHEYRLRHRDGSVRWVRESGRGVYDEDGQLRWIDGVLIDHTEIKARNAEFEGTVTAINRAVAVVEYSLDGHVLHANQNFLDMFGYNLDEVQGEHYHLFCLDTPQCHAETALMWQQLQRGDFASLECQARVKHGELLWVQTTFSPILDACGKTLRITQLLTDITASRTLSEALLQAKEKAEAAAAARSTFLANMSHEIRTPMNAIIGFSETLLDTPLGATQQRYVETVYRSARSMLRLLNDILDTAKLDKGAVQLEEEDFVVADVCHLVVGTLRIQAEKKGLHLLLDIQPQVPAYLRGDAMRIQQVLTNLMGNAVKFTERGHVLLEVGYHQGMLQLRVQDTGIGIAQEKLSHIFDPFAQADASTTRRYGGTGLGTTISRQLTQLMGGQISVRSQLGAGTEFLVQLPLPAGQAPERRLPAAHSATLPALRILAVDDVPQNLELLQVVMQRYGHSVALAHDGHEAVHLRQTQDFDLILMDLQMPHMDGLEAARSIRHWEATHGQRHIPIIALSASVLAQDRQNSDAAGMDGFATKPLELPKLMAEMARVLSEHPRHTCRRSPAGGCPRDRLGLPAGRQRGRLGCGPGALGRGRAPARRLGPLSGRATRPHPGAAPAGATGRLGRHPQHRAPHARRRRQPGSAAPAGPAGPDGARCPAPGPRRAGAPAAATGHGPGPGRGLAARQRTGRHARRTATDCCHTVFRAAIPGPDRAARAGRGPAAGRNRQPGPADPAAVAARAGTGDPAGGPGSV